MRTEKEKSQHNKKDVDILCKYDIINNEIDLSKLRNKEWFEIEDLLSDPVIRQHISLLIISSKKGIGKSYAIVNSIKDCVLENRKFLYMRRIDDELDTMGDEWKEDPDFYPFHRVKNGVFDNNTNQQIGRVCSLGRIHHYSSHQFNGYKYIFFDEYQDKNKRYKANEFKQVLTLVANLQRNKKDVKMFMFGNNESGGRDPYSRGFGIDYNAEQFIDIEAGVMYVNLTNCYKGSITKDTVAYKLSKYDPEYRAFLDGNEAQDVEYFNIIETSKCKIDWLESQFILNNEIYNFGYNEDKSLCFIKFALNRIDNVPLIALTQSDKANTKDAIMPSLIETFANRLYQLIKIGILWFDNNEVRDNIKKWLTRVLGVI